MNIVFLDVDGILAYSKYRNKDTENIDPEKVILLKELCDKTNSKVVIISSWRGTKEYTPYIYHTLIRILTEYGIKVLGDAPYIDPEYDEDISHLIALTTIEDLDLKPIHGTGRAAEVKSFLKDNKIDNFVILDDEDWWWADYGLDKNWIQPSWFSNGLQKEHIEKAIEIFKLY